MANYIEVTNGRILIMPRGEWNSTTTYSMLDIVNENGRSYIVKKTVPLNTPPSSDISGEYYQTIGTASSGIIVADNEPGQRENDMWLQEVK